MVEQRQVASDNFQRYFAEKLWEMIPTVYKMQDGADDNPSPGALRALVEVIAEQAAVLRRSHDRLWEDQFVETADDWAIPYIADLVATRLVSASNLPGRRVDVAKTIYYRRRKGTLAVLEELISDIARWDGKTVEMFRRLARARHRLDPDPSLEAGRFSGTMPGGWADLRNFAAGRSTDGPFDEYHHTPDVRKHSGGKDGRHGIPKLAFHLYRLKAFRVNGVTPRLIDGSNGFTFDPSGRDTPLFMPRNRSSEWADWRSALEWELPGPVALRLLNHAEFMITERAVRTLEDEAGLTASAVADLRTLRGIRFRSEERLRETLGALPSSGELLDSTTYTELATLALTADCGKAALLPDDSGQPTLTSDAFNVTEAGGGLVPRQTVLGDGLGGWASTGSAPERRLAVDPTCGRMLFLDGPDSPVTADYHYGFPAEIGAGTYDRRLCLAEEIDTEVSGGGTNLDFEFLQNDGVAQINDSATYEPASDKLAVQDLRVQAANGERPYVVPGANWVFNAGDNADARATLDGLWVGSNGGEVIFRAELEGVEGNYERVMIRHCTLDPGGTAADGSPISPVPLVIDCRIEELIIQRSILSSIRTTERGVVEKLVICDSILDPVASGAPAIELQRGEAILRRVTSFGEILVQRLRASELLATSTVTVTDTQQGCFRFSAAAAGSRLPSPYRAAEFSDTAHFFTSRRFGDPAYGQLSASAPESVTHGAEDGSEMGAFSAEKNPAKQESLLAKAGEHMPFGMIPLLIMES